MIRLEERLVFTPVWGGLEMPVLGGGRSCDTCEVSESKIYYH